MSLQSRSHFKTSVVLMRAGHLFIHNYIISLIHIIVRPILYVNMIYIKPSFYPMPV